MTNLTETSGWDAGVLQFATTDPIQGGPGGIDNQPHQSLADRTLWLRNRIGAVVTQAGLTDGTTDNQQLAEAVVIHCANLTALRALPIPVVPNGQRVVVITRGQVSETDGLGNLYLWVFNAANVDNGTNVIEPNSNPALGRWIACGLNASFLNGQSAANFLTAAQAASIYETITDATAKLAAAEAFATSAASTALSNAETFAQNAANAAQGAAETFAQNAANTAQGAAQSFASTAATNAQNAAIASAEAFATTVANNALSSAETFAANGSNISAGTVPSAHLPLILNLQGVTIAADPGTVPSGPAGSVWFYF
jgi:hypothetical protein